MSTLYKYWLKYESIISEIFTMKTCLKDLQTNCFHVSSDEQCPLYLSIYALPRNPRESKQDKT